MVKTLHLRDYNDVFYVGHYFREGTAVVMDLTGLADTDATPLVDFASGLVLGLGGDMEKVTAGVFLLRPEGMVAPEYPREVPV